MAAPNRESVLHPVLITPEQALWALAVLLTAVEVGLAAAGTRPVAAAPTGLGATVGVAPLGALAGLKALALGLAAAAWAVLPAHLRPVVPGVVAGVSAAVLLAPLV